MATSLNTTNLNSVSAVLTKNAISESTINRDLASQLSSATKKQSNGDPTSLLTYAMKFTSYDMTVPTKQKIIPETFTMNACFPGLKNLSVTPPIYVLQFPGTSFGLIFFFPNSNDVKSYDEFRFGFGEVDATYDIGWRVYKTRVSDVYKQVFTTWCMTLPNNVSDLATTPGVSSKSKTITSELSKMEKTLNFSVAGASTGDRGVKNISVRFNYIPGSVPTVPPVSTIA